MTSVGVYELCNVHKEKNPEPVTKLKLFSFPPRSRLQETFAFSIMHFCNFYYF